MSTNCCMLPEKFVKSYYKWFNSVGIEPVYDIIEELLYEIGRAGLDMENVSALRYCRLGDKYGFEKFKNVESIGLGNVWEHQTKHGNNTYILACNYK